MSNLIGKTIVITGGSQGIGHAMAKRFARAGGNVVILAKEENADNLNNLVDELKKTGGHALAFNVDVRDEEALTQVFTQVVDSFNGVDVLINNVSAFCFTDTMHTTSENFDLLFSTNVRATFLVSKIAVPHLKRASNPHIINISPPLEMQAQWFKNHLAFTMSKYGMSMCTLGMAAEFKGIAVNSLWPKTTIATNTIETHFTAEVYAGSRWPTIMADAAYELIQRKAKKCTGQFFIDETLLRETGITDFNQYAVDHTVPLIQDLFVPEEEGAMLLEKHFI